MCGLPSEALWAAWLSSAACGVSGTGRRHSLALRWSGWAWYRPPRGPWVLRAARGHHRSSLPEACGAAQWRQVQVPQSQGSPGSGPCGPRLGPHGAILLLLRNTDLRVRAGRRACAPPAPGPSHTAAVGAGPLPFLSRPGRACAARRGGSVHEATLLLATPFLFPLPILALLGGTHRGTGLTSCWRADSTLVGDALLGPWSFSSCRVSSGPWGVRDGGLVSVGPPHTRLKVTQAPEGGGERHAWCSSSGSVPDGTKDSGAWLPRSSSSRGTGETEGGAGGAAGVPGGSRVGGAGKGVTHVGAQPAAHAPHLGSRSRGLSASSTRHRYPCERGRRCPYRADSRLFPKSSGSLQRLPVANRGREAATRRNRGARARDRNLPAC